MQLGMAIGVYIEGHLDVYVPRGMQAICGICHNLLQQPVQLKSGHRFCYGCIFVPNFSINLHPPQCVMCGIAQNCLSITQRPTEELIFFRMLFRDRGAENDIKNLEAECRFCQQRITYKEKELHRH